MGRGLADAATEEVTGGRRRWAGRGQLHLSRTRTAHKLGMSRPKRRRHETLRARKEGLGTGGEPHKWSVQLCPHPLIPPPANGWRPGDPEGRPFSQCERILPRVRECRSIPNLCRLTGHIRRRGVKIVPALVSHQSHRGWDSPRRVRVVSDERTKTSAQAAVRTDFRPSIPPLSRSGGRACRREPHGGAG